MLIMSEHINTAKERSAKQPCKHKLNMTPLLMVVLLKLPKKSLVAVVLLWSKTVDY